MGLPFYPLMEATFKANGDTMIYVMPSHVSLVRQEALPHLVGETVCSVRRVPPPRKILTGGLSKASTFRTTTPPHPQVILALGQRRSSSPARAESAAGDVSSAWRGRKGPRHTHPANPHSRIWQSRGCRESGNVETGISLPPREWREQGAHRARGRTRVEAQRGPKTGVLPIPGTSHRSRSPRHRACCRLLPSRNFASLMETVARANSLLPRPAAPISASRAPPAGRGLPVDPGERARLAPHQEGGGVEVAWPGHARGHPAGPRPAAGRPLPPSPPPSLRLPAPNPTLPRLLPSQLTPAPRPPGGRRGPQPKEGAQLGRPGD